MQSEAIDKAIWQFPLTFCRISFAVSQLFRIFANVNKKLIMANAMTMPTEGQLIVSVEDASMLKDLKKAIGMMRGVTKITIPRRRKISSYERSLRDLDEGRVFKYDSLDDLIKEIEG